MTDGRYLIWSHEHHAWWGPDCCGYTSRLSKAGRYSREEAIRICAGAAPGTSTQQGALPELPVPEADMLEILERYDAIVSSKRPERWR